MAERKLVSLDPTEGFQEEINSTDTITVGGLTMLGDIVMSGNSITGLGSPVNPGDAATKQYADTIASGLDPKGSARVATASALPSYTASGSGVGKKLTATVNGALVVDGVSVVLNDRVLVKSEASAHVDHGIYDVTVVGDGVTPWELTRATDADENSEVTAGMFLFVNEGTTLSDTGWLLISNDPITVDTTALQFTQYAGPGSFTGGNGIDITGKVISTDISAIPGLEFTTGKLQVLVDPAGAVYRNSSGIGVNLETTNPSLGIVSNELGIKFDPSGGLEKTISGTKVKLDGTTLSLSASGLSVLGVPSAGTWEIGGVATGIGVTAPNLDTLTDGSNADALHTHNFPSTTTAERLEKTYTTAVDTTVNSDPVYINGNNTVGKANASVTPSTRAKARPIGIIRTGAGAPGSIVTVVYKGPCPGVLTGATAGQEYYLQIGGGIGTTVPASGTQGRLIRIGKAENATDLFVDIHDYGRRN